MQRRTLLIEGGRNQETLPQKTFGELPQRAKGDSRKGWEEKHQLSPNFVKVLGKGSQRKEIDKLELYENVETQTSLWEVLCTSLTNTLEPASNEMKKE